MSTEYSDNTLERSAGGRIAIIGGGITGLAAAWQLFQEGAHGHVRLFEAAGRLGGTLETRHEQGHLLERAADSFLATDDVPWCRQLVAELGLADQLITTSVENRRALVLRNGKLYPVPAGFYLMAPTSWSGIWTTGLLSMRGKLRLAAERLIPARSSDSEESLAAFASRRLGKEAFDWLVQPLAAGIYAADPSKLSMQAAFSQFARCERECGSLTLGARRLVGRERSSGARYGQFLTLRHGVQQLTDRLAASLPAAWLRLNSPVESIERWNQRSWCLQIGGQIECFDRLIVATPASVAARLLANVDARLAGELGAIQYTSVAVVCLSFCRKQIRRPVRAFGIVIPVREQRPVFAVSCASVKFPGRAPPDHELFRVFLGGYAHPEHMAMQDTALVEIAHQQLRSLLKIDGRPRWVHIARWTHATPQYELRHLERISRIRQRLVQLGGLALAGNSYDGLGIPQCIASGRAAARATLDSYAQE